MMSMTLVLIIAVVICILVIFVSALTTSKAYTTVKHTVDPLENNPHLEQMKQDEEKKE
ncbi:MULTISPECIES: YtzI protein [Rossellomorea]|nr:MULTISPECIES: YtzI protein [Rossellomorea]MCA0150900.1 YtzI protein [Rossellomorea vietnamensis]UTE76989.1 YtzI protein [Rossellomorea sp. KS-H15a]WGG44905.1 YtzI protein [Rossellomorea sp. DA94]WQI95114.1 YtzI protein [Rossellomorea vietnamensis]